MERTSEGVFDEMAIEGAKMPRYDMISQQWYVQDVSHIFKRECGICIYDEMPRIKGGSTTQLIGPRL